jgi:hypothetical protein
MSDEKANNGALDIQRNVDHNHPVWDDDHQDDQDDDLQPGPLGFGENHAITAINKKLSIEPKTSDFFERGGGGNAFIL